MKKIFIRTGLVLIIFVISFSLSQMYYASTQANSINVLISSLIFPPIFFSEVVNQLLMIRVQDYMTCSISYCDEIAFILTFLLSLLYYYALAILLLKLVKLIKK